MDKKKGGMGKGKKDSSLTNNENDIENEENRKIFRKEVRVLKSLVEDEQKLMQFYQDERERTNMNWIIMKKEMEQKKAEILNKEREIEDLKDNQVMTMNFYKQKIKHLLFQNQDQKSDLKREVSEGLKHLEDDHRMKEREIKTDQRAQKVKIKEQEIGHLDYTHAVDVDFDCKCIELRQEYERQFNDVKEKYDLKMKKLRQEMEDQRLALIKQAEELKNEKILALTKEHSKKYTDIKNYYSDITATNLDMIKTLKNEINALIKNEERDKKILQQLEKANKELKDPIRFLTKEIEQLLKQKEERKQIEDEKKDIKKKIEESELFYRKMEYEYEVKLQEFKYLKIEKESLFKRFNEIVYGMQQKIGLKNLILEKKTEGLQDDLEVKELHLGQVLEGTNLQEQGLQKSLEDVEISKSNIISEMEKQLLEIRKAHSHMVKAYEGKLNEFVIPVEELGFDPLVPTNIE